MRTFTGQGAIKFEKIGEIEGNFTLLFEDDGRTILKIDSSEYMNTSEFWNKMAQLNVVGGYGNFSGSIDSPMGRIEVEQVYLTRVRLTEIQLECNVFRPVHIKCNPLNPEDEIEVRYGLTNFTFFGRDITKRNGKFWRDTIRLKIKNHNVALVQLPDYHEIERKLREKEARVNVTSEMVFNIKAKDIPSIEKVAENIICLCSLATGNYVTGLYRESYKDDIIAESTLKPLKTYPFTIIRSAIDTSIRGHENREFEKFIEISHPNFIKYKDELGLPLVIEYYITSKIIRPLEIGFLLGAITFECIESYLSQYFKTRGIKKDLSNFRNKTRAILDEFSVTYQENELDFIGIRDKIVHSGRFPKGKNEIEEEYYKLVNLLDRTLLTILGYKSNPYINITSKSKEILR